jgi:glycosyltransferase involved in cell wall biosynthesis
MRRMFLGETAEISVVVRTDNAEETLEALLASLKGQQLPYETELLAVDAGSTDRTPLLLRAQGIRTFHAPAGGQWYGKAVEAAEGKVIVFVSQDVMPLDDAWLLALATPLFEEEGVGTAHGRFLGDASLPPYARGLMAARSFVSGKQRAAFSGADRPAGAGYFPSINCAYSRKAFKTAGLPDKPEPGYPERFYQAGLSKIYVPEAAVVLRQAAPADVVHERQEIEPVGKVGFRPAAGRLARVWSELTELSERGNLLPGEKGEAYAEAIAAGAGEIASRLEGHGKIAGPIVRYAKRLISG